MKFSGLLAAVVILLALGGVLYWSEHHKAAESAATTSSATPVIVKVDPGAVASLTIRAKGSEPVVLSKSGSKWQITAPTPAAADSGAVSGMLTALAPLNSDRVIEDKGANLAAYGLNDPTVEVDVAASGNKTPGTRSRFRDS